MKKIMKRIAAVNDLSSVGKCSLMVVIPILSSMGYEVCPIVTAYLSAHTGFQNPVIVDMTDKTEAVLNHIDSLDMDFDCIFTGYMASNSQINRIKSYVAKKKDERMLVLVDPVLGDQGKLYSTFDQKSIYGMRELCLFANVITPNFTEACFLAGLPYQEEITQNQAEHLIVKLNSLGMYQKIVITSVPFAEKGQGMIISEFGEVKLIFTDYVKGEYCGAGDAFSALMCGSLLKGKNLEESAEFSHSFLKDVIEKTHQLGGTWEQGIVLEEFLNRL